MEPRESIHLSPEIEAALRAEAAARGVAGDSLVSDAIEAFLRASRPGQATRRVPIRDRHVEMAWAAAPDPRYIGTWVVLEGNQVIASGSDAKRLYDDVRNRGIDSPFLIFVSSEEGQLDQGGWID